MSRIAECPSIIEVLRRITLGGPEWAHRNVTLRFPGPSSAWVLVYPLEDASTRYFDFMYTRTEPPQQALGALLTKYPACSVIDWSPGRLACISAPGVDVETLADIIREVAETAWDEPVTVVEASYEEMGRA
ncbi:hypothetical protein [Pseudomonas rubra]|uniref:Uncharacterized protein n=1 Tax=Pseudomonas rubra TaxID=2942627 RepID=A0ABT5P9R4_9PSED|nr:hypothetical protein [Pseudomonas rubra]MDD1015008.1 hypothetical protein [Pseudomonas rubra]MDD1038657.1 hypothetical protein [Pseudomonas rubra]MDD1154651.1 hypothetical protein [Pseudomonas rubra]